MKKTLLAFSLLAALSTPAHSHKHHDHDEKVEHIGVHVHGEGQLNIVLDGRKLIIELDTPAMNVLGFEHEPSTKKQKRLVKKAEHELEHADELFVIKGGKCRLDEVDIDLPFDDDDDDDKHDHDHDDEHKHHKHTHKDGDVHSDIEAEYEFKCKKPKKIKNITVNLFEVFSGFEKLKVQWVVGDKQGAQTLTKTSNVLKLK